MQCQFIERKTKGAQFCTAARLWAILLVAVGLLLSSSQLWSQESRQRRPSCDLSGTWYGGSIVAYHLTIIPGASEGHYTVLFEGMYKNSVMNTHYSGEITRRGDHYTGPIMQLTTSDPDFLNPPPIGKMPDIIAGWTSMEMEDCNTIKNTIPFFGLYFAGNIWQPGIIWNAAGKIPLVDAPDVDLLDILNGGRPIVETYHRLPKVIEPALLHKE
jgi:hypothetical protein